MCCDNLFIVYSGRLEIEPFIRGFLLVVPSEVNLVVRLVYEIGPCVLKPLPPFLEYG